MSIRSSSVFSPESQSHIVTVMSTVSLVAGRFALVNTQPFGASGRPSGSNSSSSILGPVTTGPSPIRTLGK